MNERQYEGIIMMLEALRLEVRASSRMNQMAIGSKPFGSVITSESLQELTALCGDDMTNSEALTKGVLKFEGACSG